ncbi:hypothetical protein F4778DRAFT_795114 [Xylariomycetidae sp. FL2044]|nr:hypothetical protein F4778DRAFT_795114 [Xylariomycetidae sp. FL2044]
MAGHLYEKPPQELKDNIWLEYFRSRNIHVIHDGIDISRAQDQFRPKCTTIDAGTGKEVSGTVRSDIDRAVQHRACKCMSRERVQHPVDAFRFEATRDYGLTADRLGEPIVSPIDIDWSIDLVYLCCAQPTYAWRTIPGRPWASKVQSLAIAFPSPPMTMGPYQWNDGPHLRREVTNPHPYSAWPLPEMPALKELMIVFLPLSEAKKSHTAAPPGTEQDGGSFASRARSLKRDHFGFVELAEVGKLGRAPLELDNFTSTYVMLQALKTIVDASGRDIVVKKLVDVDLVCAENGEYSRIVRGRSL